MDATCSVTIYLKRRLYLKALSCNNEAIPENKIGTEKAPHKFFVGSPVQEILPATDSGPLFRAKR